MNLRTRILASEHLIGTVVSVPDPSLAEVAALAFDLLWIDLEHGSLDVRDLPTLLPAIRASGAAAVVRLPGPDTERLPAILDAGVDGVVVPRIESAAEVEAFVARLSYPPGGTRGFGPRRAGGYGRTPRFWASELASPAVLLQIESQAGINASEEIAAVNGVDALVVGSADLSFALGEPQVHDSETFRDAVEKVRAAAVRAGRAFGVAGGAVASVSELLGETGTIAILSVDVRLYAAAVDAAAEELRHQWVQLEEPVT